MPSLLILHEGDSPLRPERLEVAQIRRRHSRRAHRHPLPVSERRGATPKENEPRQETTHTSHVRGAETGAHRFTILETTEHRPRGPIPSLRFAVSDSSRVGRNPFGPLWDTP